MVQIGDDFFVVWDRGFLNPNLSNDTEGEWAIEEIRGMHSLEPRGIGAAWHIACIDISVHITHDWSSHHRV